ncbi:C19orf47 [Branchiostoma lanceolatum]|uniref:C19orf47 protein n=1 Tax=Branchiostoma lanceolatum TaxID=7740 RepID=A0A8K0ESX6_BRALA|nr:C19orf47 [Branchiostoma lanceolatum]
MASQSETSTWIKFFMEAGIPAGPAASYAVTFADNRIQKTMLLDLSKEILNDMGIVVVGDVIAILKHAKTVAQQAQPCLFPQEQRDKVLQVSVPQEPPRRKPAGTPASRMVGHYLRDSPSNSPYRMSLDGGITSMKRTIVTDLDEEEVVGGMKKSRKVAMPEEGSQTIIVRMPDKMPANLGPSKKASSVFDRLGGDTPADSTKPKASGVFSRLGDQSEAAEPALEYHGVLKQSPSAVKALAVAPTTAAAPAKKGVHARLGPQTAEKGIRKRLGPENVDSTTGTAKPSVLARLGQKRTEKMTVTNVKKMEASSSDSVSDDVSAKLSAVRKISGIRKAVTPAGKKGKGSVSVAKVSSSGIFSYDDSGEETGKKAVGGGSVFARLGKI